MMNIFVMGMFKASMGQGMGSSHMADWELCKHLRYDLLHLLIIDDENIKMKMKLVVLRG